MPVGKYTVMRVVQFESIENGLVRSKPAGGS